MSHFPKLKEKGKTDDDINHFHRRATRRIINHFYWLKMYDNLT